MAPAANSMLTTGTNNRTMDLSVSSTTAYSLSVNLRPRWIENRPG